MQRIQIEFIVNGETTKAALEKETITALDIQYLAEGVVQDTLDKVSDESKTQAETQACTRLGSHSVPGLDAFLLKKDKHLLELNATRDGKRDREAIARQFNCIEKTVANRIKALRKEA